MASVRLADIDLNLLVALDALLREASVTRAAKRLGIGQPAMSGALARLRGLLDDPLLVRTSAGMTLTARALALCEPVADLLRRIDDVLGPTAAFDAATVERTFAICTSDHLELLLLPALCARLSADAPGVRIEVRALDHKRLAEELGAGAVDLAIGPFRDAAAGLFRHVLFDETLVCLVRGDHPGVGATLTLAEYVALDHVLVSPRGGTRGHVDRVLEERGLARRVVMSTPHFLVVPAVVARTELVATVPEQLGRTLAAQLGLRIVALPIELEPATHVALWHERSHRDPGHQWLRTVLGELVAEL
jgi:DNA-binding transcriptional LysR family regulator